MLVIASAFVLSLGIGVGLMLSLAIHDQEALSRRIIMDIAVRSQQLSLLAQDAVAGDAGAFPKLKATSNAIETDIRALQDGTLGHLEIRGVTGAAELRQHLGATWSYMSANTEVILRNRESLLRFVGAADRLTNELDSMKSAVDEMARAMSIDNEPTSQLILLMREISIADSIGRDVALMREGNAHENELDAMGRESALFSRVLKGFKDGDASLGIHRLIGANASTALESALRLNQQFQEEHTVSMIQHAFRQFEQSRDASKQIADESVQLLATAQKL
jgi:hypothetical protein